MARYLVTGGAGFIGSHLCDALLAAGHDVTVVDNLSTGKRANLPGGVTLIEADCADKRQLPGWIAQADGVFHLAAIASVAQSVQHWSDTSRTNQFATIALLEAISRRAGGVIPFVYASSAAVYGNPQEADLPLKESAPLKPLTPYGADKLGCELHAGLARHLFGIPTLGLRFFNVYGPRQDPASPYSGVISIFCERIAAGQAVTIFGDGEQNRDFIYVGDVVACLCAAMKRLSCGDIPDPPALNVCSGERVSINQLSKEIANIAGKPLTTSHAPARAGDIRHSQGCKDEMKKWLETETQTTLKDGLRNITKILI